MAEVMLAVTGLALVPNAVTEAMGSKPDAVTIHGPLSERPHVEWTFRFKKMPTDRRRKGYEIILGTYTGKRIYLIAQDANELFDYQTGDSFEEVVGKFRSGQASIERKIIQFRKAG